MIFKILFQGTGGSEESKTQMLAFDCDYKYNYDYDIKKKTKTLVFELMHFCILYLFIS